MKYKILLDFLYNDFNNKIELIYGKMVLFDIVEITRAEWELQGCE